jgi:hypothetical protein
VLIATFQTVQVNQTVPTMDAAKQEQLLPLASAALAILAVLALFPTVQEHPIATVMESAIHLCLPQHVSATLAGAALPALLALVQMIALCMEPADLTFSLLSATASLDGVDSPAAM